MKDFQIGYFHMNRPGRNAMSKAMAQYCRKWGDPFNNLADLINPFRIGIFPVAQKCFFMLSTIRDFQ
jgi:hypothetical protein